MTQKYISLALLLTLSSAVAAPLVGTKASVNESSFCKKYKCTFVDSTLNKDKLADGTTPYIKTYSYKLANGANLKVVREKDNTIFSAWVYKDKPEAVEWFYYKGDSFVKDFALNFTGISSIRPLNGTCITGTMVEDIITNAILGERGNFKIGCNLVFGNSFNNNLTRFSISANSLN
jgi:hypothetical protein